MVSSGSMCDRAGRRLVAAVGAWLLLLPAGAPLRAQDTTAPPADTEVAAVPGADGTISTLVQDELSPSGIAVSDEAIQLSLADALSTALERNLGLHIQRYERAQFRLRVDENLGIYDLGLGAQIFEESETSPSTSRVASPALSAPTNGS